MNFNQNQNKAMEVKVRHIELNELKLIVRVLNQLPEFDAVFYEPQLRRRLSKPESILLIAEADGVPVACLAAYNRYFDGSIYAWLGGVLPGYRKQGIAQALQKALENEARRKLFLTIKMKTRNKHVSMLRFVLQQGFQIVGFMPKAELSESRIELMKRL